MLLRFCAFDEDVFERHRYLGAIRGAESVDYVLFLLVPVGDGDCQLSLLYLLIYDFSKNKAYKEEDIRFGDKDIFAVWV